MPDRDPDVAQALGRALVVEILRSRLVDVRERPLDRPDDVGDGDVCGWTGEPIAALGAAPGLDQASVLHLQQDVLQELQGDSLGLREVAALDRLAILCGRQLERCSYGVIGLGADPHTTIVANEVNNHARVATVGRMIDLQSHSVVSDGQLEPAGVVRAAAEAGITVMALTDHDGVAGVAEANATAAEVGIQNVPAVEMSCVHKYSEDLHVCGYWVDVVAIQPACDRAQQERVDRAKEIISRLNQHGVDVTFEGAVEKAGAADAIGRPHIAKAAGAGPDLGPFFEEYLVPGAKAFVSRSWPSAEEAVNLIHEAGGVAVVAHPYWDVQDPEQVRDLVGSLVSDVSLDGIETFYPPHTAEQTKHCLELCEEFGLVPTASSDFHGPTHKTFSRWGAYDTYGLGEPQVPEKP